MPNMVATAVEERRLVFIPGMNDDQKAQAVYVETLCKVFIQHVPAILPLHSFHGEPPFHEMWLRILQVLQPFLLSKPQARPRESPAVPAAELDSSGRESTAFGVAHRELEMMALEYVKLVLLVMDRLGLFSPGDRTVGLELWEFTWTILDSFPMCEGLCVTLFPGSSFSNPPTSDNVDTPLTPTSFRVPVPSSIIMLLAPGELDPEASEALKEDTSEVNVLAESLPQLSI